jgi:hypothetical protein
MTARKFAVRIGWFMFLLGLISLIPLFTGPRFELPDLRLNVSYGKFFGYLPLNILSKLILIGFGLGGILVARKKEEDPSIDYARVLFYTMGTFGSCSFFRDTNTFFGYMPLNYGAGIFFCILAVFGFVFGYVTHRAQLHDDEPETHAV